MASKIAKMQTRTKRMMAITNPNRSRWSSFSDEEMESIRQAIQKAEDEGMIDSVGEFLLIEIENELDSR
jgi:hypothetical protein